MKERPSGPEQHSSPEPSPLPKNLDTGEAQKTLATRAREEEKERTAEKLPLGDSLSGIDFLPTAVKNETKDSIFATADTQVVHSSTRLFPYRAESAEASLLGKSFFRDISGFALGIGDSLVSIATLGRDGVVDLARLIAHPRREIETTQKFL